MNCSTFNDPSGIVIMDTRREFLKKAGLLSGFAGMNAVLPASIQRALAIEAAPGTTFMDAEHVVILMQENRSFDHTYGTLRGVRGFNDPRAIQLANQQPVWLQSDAAGNTYAPFRLDMKDTKSTWMDSLPHSWKNQVNTRNDGKHDQWLNEKRNSIPEYADMPLTLGYYNREDIPFYYALADGFTVCDQHFCSALTGTNPNRLYFWSGTIRAEQNENSRAHVWNDDADFSSLHWKTFPEILEENNVSWKYYQNELSINVGFVGEQDSWLSNFQDNPLEFFAQYHVRLHQKHLDYLQLQKQQLPAEIDALKKQMENLRNAGASLADIQKSLTEKQKSLNNVVKELEITQTNGFNRLSDQFKNLHQKAFVTNINDPDYHNLESLTYHDQGLERSFQVPKGDLLHQFREDVKTGQLPTVSWLAAPENLSDHPSSAWYGAWYVSEVMDILTRNPEIWKKTIFILTYDENDGYFDHVPPFVAPHSGRKDTGMVSAGIDTRVEYVTAEQEAERKGFPEPYDRESPIGLGFRVPLVIASPWTRGGYVNSEVFDHTSTLQFLETFLNRKTGKKIHASNISDWRRTICGDLTSVFRTSGTDEIPALEFLAKQPFLESVYNSKFKHLPNAYKKLTDPEIQNFLNDPYASPYMPVQENGIRPSCGLHYQLYADGQFNPDSRSFDLHLKAGDEIFGGNSLGAPFNVYVPGKYKQLENQQWVVRDLRSWAFAVKSADHLDASWPLENFEADTYHLRVYGPNGFYREFKGSNQDPPITVFAEYQRRPGLKNKLSGNLIFLLTNPTAATYKMTIKDNAYRSAPVETILPPGSVDESKLLLPLDLSKQFGWYDFTINIAGNAFFERRYAGKIETGESGFSDPFMGRVV